MKMKRKVFKAPRFAVAETRPVYGFIGSAKTAAVVKPAKKKAAGKSKAPAKTAAPPPAEPRTRMTAPQFTEAKSKRMHILIKPSLFERIKAAAQANGESVNGRVHAILETAHREG